nr:hypothetical protein BaRGS_017126 [Batillaria attramentaria]
MKVGVDVSANQEEEESDKEIFQMEYDRHTGKWAFRTVDNKYWILEPLGGIQAVGTGISDLTLFDVEWQDDGTISIKANNNNYVFNKPAGSLYAGSETVGDKEKFRVKIVNRPVLVLKSDHGFVGSKSPGAAKAEMVCNRSTYEVIYMEHSPEPNKEGVYFMKATNGKYWRVDEDGSVKADGASKSEFRLQVRGTALTIRADNGCYMKGEQNGLFRAVGQDLQESGILWEF